MAVPVAQNKSPVQHTDTQLYFEQSQEADEAAVETEQQNDVKSLSDELQRQ